jgi:hypothetical protein
MPYETWSGGGPQGFLVPPGVCTPGPNTGGGNPTGGHASATPPACVPVPGDGLCSACENTDLDSASCVCNMNGVCDPQEGFNCGDCQPTAVPGGDKPGGKSGGKSGGGSGTCVDPTTGKPC